MKILKLILFQLLILSFAKAQNTDFLAHNYKIKLNQISAKLKSYKVPAYDGSLLSVSNIIMNYPNKDSVPKILSELLLKENIINSNTNIFLVAEYTYSNYYDSYLLLATETNNEELFEIKNLYLLNIKEDCVISICQVSSYNNFEGLSMQSYTIYQENKFRNFTESIGSDVEIGYEGKKIKQRPVILDFKIDSKNGKTTILKNN